MDDETSLDAAITWEDLVTALPMSSEDLPEAMAIERTTIYSPWSEYMFQTEINQKNLGLITFRIKGQLVGYFCFWKVLDEAHLLNLSIHVDFRGKGLGTFLMKYLEQICINMDISSILLEVAKTNYSAINLYNKCGFVRIGMRNKFYPETGDDAIVMRKRLNKS
ncbi:MAG: ribosomal protein S18-alanine N-acetyltransferase [Deltaproteobacteria bacterium]|nr:ribosomal protein S18-alanine N-acetyltransferase [Deltaproteobacteria bacterium]